MFSIFLLFLPLMFLLRTRACSSQAEGTHASRLSLEVASCSALSDMFWLLNLKSSYYVNRDTSFATIRPLEVFLQRLMALYVASHYKVTETSPQMDLSSEFQLLAVPYLTFCILLPSGSGDHSTGTRMS